MTVDQVFEILDINTDEKRNSKINFYQFDYNYVDTPEISIITEENENAQLD